jgi:hypothetical protein
MRKALTVITMLVVVGGTAAFGAGFWRGEKFAPKLAHGLMDGVILGSNVWPYHPSLVRANIEARLLVSGYGVAAVPADEESVSPMD